MPSSVAVVYDQPIPQLLREQYTSMKSEHRHELAENDLAKLLSRWGAEVDKHVNVILSVLIVIALLAIGYTVWSKTSSAANEAGWTELAAAREVEDYVNVAETFPGTKVAEWATLRAADGLLREGIAISLSNRPRSNENLEQALESYDSLLKNSAVPAEIREQALLGNALALEASSDGDTSGAIAAYEALIGEFETTRFKAFAEDRIAALKTGGVQDFYAWFHQLNPKPADRPLPQDQGDSLNANPLEILGNSSFPDFPFSSSSSSAGDDSPVDSPDPFATQQTQDKTGAEPQDPSAQSPSPEAVPPENGPPGSSEEKPAENQTGSNPDESAPEDSTPADAPADESATKSEDESPPELP